MHRGVCCYLSGLQVLQSATLAWLKKKKMKREAVEHLRCATTRWQPIWNNVKKKNNPKNGSTELMVHRD